MGITRKILNWYAKLSPRRRYTIPPYKHVVQIGDPALRRVSAPVPIENIANEKTQKVIQRLEMVLNRYNCVGLSAPQIGINMRIFAMQYSTKQLTGVSNNIIIAKGIQVVPFTVFINPTLKVLDYTKISDQEGCESIRGLAAEVARYKQIEVSAYNEAGEQFTKQYSDWTARIVQHELDHLEGTLYTDIMDRKTFACLCWEEVNLSQGKVEMPFYPE